jgi:hypothetical protein
MPKHTIRAATRGCATSDPDIVEGTPLERPQASWHNLATTDILDGVRDHGGSSREHLHESWYGALTAVIALSAAGVLAVGIAMSAILVVSRERVSPAGAVIPTHSVAPSTTTGGPPTASTSSPVATQAPSRAPANTPSATTEPTAAPNVPPPPKPPAPRSTTPPPPNSVQPTSHRAFPQETTDFPGPPGTNG